MNAKLTERLRVDLVRESGTVSTSATGRGVKMAEFEKVLFILTIGAVAASKVASLKVRQAKTAAGGDIKDISALASTSDLEADIATNTRVMKVNVAFDTVVTTNTLKVNGMAFTAKDTSPDIEAGEWATGADDTAAAVNLAAAINHHRKTVGVEAIASTTNVILHAMERPVTVTDATATRFVVTTLSAALAVEIKAAELDTANGFDHAVPVIATDDAAAVCTVTAIRGDARRIPVQVVAGFAE